MATKGMNPEAKKELDRILEKAKTDPLADHELDFLRARQVYIKEGQLKYVGKLLKATKAEKKAREEKKELAVEQGELDADEMNRTAHPAEKDEERIPYGELQDRAKKLGLKFVGIKRVVLEKEIKEKEKKK